MINPRIYAKIFSRLHRLHQKSNERAASFKFFTPRGTNFISLPRMETNALEELKYFYRRASGKLLECSCENEIRDLCKSLKLEETRLLEILVSIKTDIVNEGEELIKPFLPSEIKVESIEELLHESTGPNYAEIRKLRLRNLKFSELHDLQKDFFKANQSDCLHAGWFYEDLVTKMATVLTDADYQASISSKTKRTLKKEILSFRKLAKIYLKHANFIHDNTTMLDIMIGSHDFLKRELAILAKLKTSVFCL